MITPIVRRAAAVGLAMVAVEGAEEAAAAVINATAAKRLT